MKQVVVSIGSNFDRYRHLAFCLDSLQQTFDNLRISRVYESEPIDLDDAGSYFNLVAAFNSDASVGELQAWCRRLENASGRTRHGREVTLDIDLLSVGELTGRIEGVELPRRDFERYAFVLKPLAELLPENHHPLSGIRYRDLWAESDAGTQRLWPVDFIWQGQVISQAD